MQGFELSPAPSEVAPQRRDEAVNRMEMAQRQGRTVSLPGWRRFCASDGAQCRCESIGGVTSTIVQVGALWVWFPSSTSAAHHETQGQVRARAEALLEYITHTHFPSLIKRAARHAIHHSTGSHTTNHPNACPTRSANRLASHPPA